MSASLLLVLLMQAKVIVSLIRVRRYPLWWLGYFMDFHFLFKEAKKYMRISFFKILVFNVLWLRSFLNNGLEHQWHRISSNYVSLDVKFMHFQDAYSLILN